MGATSNTSSLLSSSSSSTNRHHHQRRSGPSGGSSRFGLTSVRRVCTTNLKNNRHNVAIATQVLSPKALSTQGSINRSRFRHFGGAESDDEEFFRRSKRRALLEKLFCYGISITVILLVMTGVVLAVGYMQSEKQRISSGSAVTVKLAQEQRLRSLNSITTQEPPQIVLAKTTVRPPTTTESMNLSKEVSIADVDMDDDIDELQILEPPAEILKEIMEARSNDRKGKFLDLEDESKHRLPSEVKVLPPDGFTFDGYSFEFPIVRPPTTNNSLTQLEKSTIASSVNISIDPVDHDEEPFNSSPSVVNANKDFSLSGFNFSLDKFPLRNFSGDFGTLSNSDERGNIMDIPVVAKLQTDLFRDDDESDNESSASNKSKNQPQVPTPTEHDGSYTPRPSSVVHYPDKPPRTSSKPYFRGGNHNHKGKSNSYNTISSPNEETTTTYPNLIEISTSAPVKIEKFDFKTTVPGITDFKFDFTTPTPEVSDYLGLNKPETKFNLPTTTTNYDFSQQATTPNYNNVDYTHLLSTLTTTPATTATISSNQDNQFSKRTYPGFDNFDSSTASTNVNPFAHLLTPFSPTSYIGSASPVGALQNFKQPSYNFDTNYDSSFNTPHSIPSGTIPLDLAASYIQAGNPPKLNSAGSSGNYGSGDSFSYGNNNNPTLALASLLQNGGGSSSGDPKTPTYNTISQGIHLLNLLSGNIPQHLLTGADQYQSASNIEVQQQQHIAKPEFQIAALTGYGGSSNAFLSGLNTNPSGNGGGQDNYFVAESRSSPSYSNDLHATKSFSSSNNHALDQLPSASSSSFRHEIISKISDEGKSHAAPSPVSPIISDALANQPKSLSLDILPRNPMREIESSLLDSFSGNKESTVKALPAESASRKKESADLNLDSPVVDYLRADLQTSGSEMHPNTKKPYKKEYKSVFAKSLSASHVKSQPFGRKLVIKTIKIKDDINQKDIKERGLKSGFYF